MNSCFIILAGGESKRFNSKTPKPYHLYKGKPLILHSIEKAKNYKKFMDIIVVINKKHKKLIKKLNIKDIIIIEGGKTRADSAYRALQHIKNNKIKNVMIHDAARPNFSLKLLDRLNKELILNDCVVPAIQTTDSIKEKCLNRFTNLKREKIYFTQTPQAFNLKEIYTHHLVNKLKYRDDDISLYMNLNNVNFIQGEKNNFKINDQNDFENLKKLSQSNTYMGIGFDVHRLVPNRKLFLAGLKIKSKLGTLGHSDGDPVLHSIIDSILGACKMGDIGQLFSDKDNKFKNIRSTILLEKVIKQINLKGFYINNIDINIIAQTPKIKNLKNSMINNIAKLCEISKEQINIKGKTTEKLGVIGKEKAIACEVITSVVKYEL